MDLCPQPEQWTILDWCEPFGILPSQLTPEDWQWLKMNVDKKWLTGWYDRWQEVAKGKASMPMDVVQYLLQISDQAEEIWQTKDSD